MKTHKGSRVTVPVVLKRGTRRRCMVILTARSIFHLENRRLPGPEGRSGRSEEKKHFMQLLGFESRIAKP